MSKCIICKSNVGNIVSNSEHYCEMCWYHENSPILVLTKKWERVSLFNPELNRYVYPMNNQMEECGFKLFNIKTFFNSQANQNYKEILVYKYSGQLRCLAIKGYKAWPTKMPNCNKIGCALY